MMSSRIRKEMIFIVEDIMSINARMDSDLNRLNEETIAAMLEAEKIAKDSSIKGYDDLDELFADLKA